MSLQTKERFIAETGGYRFLESNEDFQRRSTQIEKIEKKIKRGKATATDINELAKLKGTGESDERHPKGVRLPLVPSVEIW